MSQNYTTTKSIWAVALEASRRPGATFAPANYSTINEKLSIATDATVPEGVFPEVQYLVIGRGGHRNVVGGNGASLTDILQHRINNACLFEHLPMVVRPVNSDLNATERKRYRLRKLIELNGSFYFAYYMLKLDLPPATPLFEKLTVVDGLVTREPYVPTAQQLDPQPVSMTNGKVNQASGEHLAVTTPFTIELSKSDITEILNAVELIYGDPRYAVISEMGVCSGVDASVSSTDGGITVNYTECLNAQIYNWIGANIDLMYQSSKLTYNARMGDSLQYLT